MNKSLYTISFYFFLCIFANSCGLNMFGNSTNETTENQTDNARQEKDTIKNDEQDVLSEKRIDNIALTSNDNTDEITLLKSKIYYLEEELKKKGDSNAIFNNPYALFNQQIVMDNGTIYYGSIIYQDDNYVTIETLIGKLNIERYRIKRVLSHHLAQEETPIFPEVDFEENILSIEEGDLLYKSPAKVILLGNINTSIDDAGNTLLRGQMQNTGGKRADFAKIHITLYRDWSQTLPPKTFTVFAEGTTYYIDDDSTKISNSSIEPKAVADFSLTVPRNFGNVMSWKYNIDFEEY